MKINNKRELENRVATSTFEVKEVDAVTQELIKDFGEMTVNIGGTVKVKVIVSEPHTEMKPVFEADGVTPVYEDDGVTQKMEEVTTYVDVEKEIDVKVGGDVFKKFPSEFPITRSFDEIKNGETYKEVAIGWSNAIKERLGSAVTELRKNVDEFSGEEEIIL